MFEEEDDEGFGLEEQLRRQMKEVANRIAAQSRKDFIEGCYSAYDMLVNKGASALDDGDMEAIGKAINRMTALFVHREEYERCKFLSDYVSKYMPGHSIVPDESVIDNL